MFREKMVLVAKTALGLPETVHPQQLDPRWRCACPGSLNVPAGTNTGSGPPSGKGRSAAAVIKKEPGGEGPALFYRKTNKRGNDRANTNRGRVKMKGVG